MNSLPQDVVVMLKLAVDPASWSYESLAHDLGLSASMVHSAVRRARAAGLYDPSRRRPMLEALLEFLVHGVRYAFPAVEGGETRGVPTAGDAPVLASKFAPSGALPRVWPHPEGRVRGIALGPLHKSAPGAALRDERLYAALALVDAVRMGRARERGLAEGLLRELLHGNA
ncbi:MAG: hypothetical protein AB7D57_09575 [Desulfovibrionaceae bacterium]